MFAAGRASTVILGPESCGTHGHFELAQNSVKLVGEAVKKSLRIRNGGLEYAPHANDSGNAGACGSNASDKDG